MTRCDGPVAFNSPWTSSESTDVRVLVVSRQENKCSVPVDSITYNSYNESK